MPFKLLKNCWRIGYMPFVFLGKRKRKLRLYRPHLGQVRKQAVNLKRVALLLIHCAIFLYFFFALSVLPTDLRWTFLDSCCQNIQDIGGGIDPEKWVFYWKWRAWVPKGHKRPIKASWIVSSVERCQPTESPGPIFFFFFFCNPDPSIPQLCDFVDIPGLDSGFLGGSGGGDTPRRFLFLRNK